MSPKLEQGLIRAHVGVGATVRLHVGVIGAEQLLDAVDGQSLDVVDHRVTAVVPLAGIPLGVLVGQHRTDCAHHRRRREVLAGDQLQAGDLTLRLGVDEIEQLCVWLGVGRERHRSLLHS